MNNQEIILAELKTAAEVLNQFIAEPENLIKIEKAAKWMTEAVKNGGKIIFMNQLPTFVNGFQDYEKRQMEFEQKINQFKSI